MEISNFSILIYFRQDENGQLRMPTKNDLICSKHFIDGEYSTHKLAPNYRPTIFPTHTVKISERDKKEYEKEQAESASKKHKKKRPRVRSYHSITQQIMNDDKKCHQMCGIPKGLFHLTYEILDEECFLDLEEHSIYDRDQLAIYFTKMKTGCTFAQIGIMFGGLNAKIVSRIFTHILSKHYVAIKDLIWWYSRKEVDETMPSEFKKLYPKTRVVLDATEIKIQV